MKMFMMKTPVRAIFKSTEVYYKWNIFACLNQRKEVNDYQMFENLTTNRKVYQ